MTGQEISREMVRIGEVQVYAALDREHDGSFRLHEIVLPVVETAQKCPSCAAGG